MILRIIMNTDWEQKNSGVFSSVVIQLVNKNSFWYFKFWKNLCAHFFKDLMWSGLIAQEIFSSTQDNNLTS